MPCARPRLHARLRPDALARLGALCLVLGWAVSDDRAPDDRAHPVVSNPPAAPPGDPAAPAPALHATLARLPKIDAVLGRDEVRALDVPRFALVQAVRELVDEQRRRILAGQAPGVLDLATSDIEQRARALARPSLRPVINATGVVIHTNLGRAPLGQAAIEHLCAIAGGYSNLEYDLDAGSRGSRHAHVTAALASLTGAEDAVVVNNNAAAVMLGLAALASGREVIVSRGELVEIGGSFRIPDVMRMSGAELVEVGTTNKTRLSDYEQAVRERTGLLLKVHRSNFAIIGFTEEVAAAELAALGQRAGIPTMVDLGSGLLLEPAELQAMGLPPEPGPRAVIAAGIDVVCFSGDKLLGGPQAGIVCGRARTIARLRAHPLMRALRPDKLTLAALDATLAAYRDRRGPGPVDVPALAMLGETEAGVRRRAEAALARVQALLADAPGRDAPLAEVALAPCESAVGGGAMPTARLPSWGLALAPVPASGARATDLELALRRAEPPVIARILDDRVVLDLRTVLLRDTEALLAAVVAAVLPRAVLPRAPLPR
jgi:L-seryl-tRNA(Ser) seleniumtransferase